MIGKKMFKCNEDGVAEFCIAKHKTEAYSFMRTQWGDQIMDEYLEEYISDNPGEDEEDFIDYFFIEMYDDEEFTLHDCGESGKETMTKTVRKWLEECEDVPVYFACSEW